MKTKRSTIFFSFLLLIGASNCLYAAEEKKLVTFIYKDGSSDAKHYGLAEGIPLPIYQTSNDNSDAELGQNLDNASEEEQKLKAAWLKASGVLDRQDPDILKMKLLLEQGGINVDWCSGSGSKSTALAHAIRWERKDVVKLLLLQHKADPNIRNRFGDTPLITAIVAKGQHIEYMVKSLLQQKADPNAKGMFGHTPLITVTFGVNPNLDRVKKNVIRLLLQYNANIYEENKEGETALDVAKRLNRVSGCNQGVIRLLQERYKRDISNAIKESEVWKKLSEKPDVLPNLIAAFAHE